jgi:tetratricopeptide (TPR) repeat protein
VAKSAVRAGQSRSAIKTLQTLAEKADTLGLKYISVECSVYLGEALVQAKDYSRARQELERALSRSETLGLKSLQAESHYRLATALRLAGSAAEAAPHYANAQRILDEMQREAKTDTLLKRADLRAIYRDSAQWSRRPPA